MIACPGLTLGGWQWVGVVGPPGSVEPYERIELVERGEQLWYGSTVATAEGSFAIRAARRARGQSEIVLVTGSGTRFSIRPDLSEGYIDYDPATFAVMEETPGVMRFRGEIASTRASTPIERAWAVNWNTGAVAPIAPTPTLDITFEHARIPGRSGQCMGIFTEHRSGRTGGCWWARPGGCLCRRCTPEQIEDGSCREDFDDGSNEYPSLGCHCQYPPPPSEPSAADGDDDGPLPVQERHDPPPSENRGGGPPPPFGAGDGAGGAPPPDHTPPPPDAYYDPEWWNADAGPVEPPS